MDGPYDGGRVTFRHLQATIIYGVEHGTDIPHIQVKIAPRGGLPYDWLYQGQFVLPPWTGPKVVNQIGGVTTHRRPGITGLQTVSDPVSGARLRYSCRSRYVSE